MKKISIAFLFLMIGVAVSAQDYKLVQTAFLLRKYEDAKTAYDKLASDPKVQNSAEGVLWKARIYATLFADSALRIKYPDAGNVALDAFNKYTMLDTSMKSLKEPGMLLVVDQLYGTNFNFGYRYFKQQKWDSAYAYFVPTYELGELITAKNWKSNNQPVDTLSLTYVGFSAQNANKKPEAVKYYAKIADHKIGGEDYKNVYRYLLINYLDSKDATNFKKYLVTANELYPEDKTTWNKYDLEFTSTSASLLQLLEKYQKDEAGGSLTAEEYQYYAQAFANPSKEEKDRLDSTKLMDLRKTAADAFKKAFNKNNNGLNAYNAGLMHYTEWDVLNERYDMNKGVTPALKAKRADIEKLQFAAIEPAIEWLEKGYTALKSKENRDKLDNSTLNRDVDFLANLYGWKRDKVRGKDPKQFDAYDAKYKLYDTEHGKYK